MDQRILQIIQKHPELKSEFEEIYPELKENEDERIRKAISYAICAAAHQDGTLINHVTKEEVLAWLEKQKEQKPFSQEVFDAAKHEALWGEQKPAGWNPTNEDVILFNKAITTNTSLTPAERAKLDIIRMKFKHCNGNVAKSAEWSKDYREEDLRTRFAFYTYKDEDDVLYLSNVFVEETSRNKGFGTKILAAAEKVAETLGVIIIRLKVKQNSPANAWYRKHGYGFMAFEGDYDWLEKTLEYMKPVKQEWSDEDEKMCNTTVEMLKMGVECYESTGRCYDSRIQKCIDWLKSLRPPPSWKPSEEQIEALENSTALNEEQGAHLYSLLCDLKKLL